MNYYGTYYTHSSDELYHYGVSGMKWGVRKADSTSNKSGKSSGKTPEQKAAAKAKVVKAAKIGAAVAGAALATYGAYKCSKYIKGKSAKIGEEACKELKYLYNDSMQNAAKGWNRGVKYNNDGLKEAYSRQMSTLSFAKTYDMPRQVNNINKHYGSGGKKVSTAKALKNVVNYNRAGYASSNSDFNNLVYRYFEKHS